MSENPWWHPREDDLGWDGPLPSVIVLSPDYSAERPPWGEAFGNIDWRFTKFPPELLDRLVAWQQEFDDNYHPSVSRLAVSRDTGPLGSASQEPGTDVREALGRRAKLVIDLWPIEEEATEPHRPDDMSRSGLSGETLPVAETRLNNGRRHRSRTIGITDRPSWSSGLLGQTAGPSDLSSLSTRARRSKSGIPRWIGFALTESVGPHRHRGTVLHQIEVRAGR